MGTERIGREFAGGWEGDTLADFGRGVAARRTGVFLNVEGATACEGCRRWELALWRMEVGGSGD